MDGDTTAPASGAFSSGLICPVAASAPIPNMQLKTISRICIVDLLCAG